MKKFMMFFAVILIVYGFINYYIGLRGWQSFGGFVSPRWKVFYWTLFWVTALAYIGARFFSKALPGPISRAITLYGSYWMAAMIYFILFLIIIDIIRLLGRWTGFVPAAIADNPLVKIALGTAVVVIVAGAMVYGTWNARTPRVNHYDISIKKNAGSLKNLHVVMVSDIHLGIVVDRARLDKMVDMVNNQKPDIVLLAGDMIDEDIKPFEEQKMYEAFQRINTKFGVYAVLGNHEYIGGHADEAVQYLEKGKMKVLLDQYVKVADSFYIVGRKDKSADRQGRTPRKELGDLMQGMDRSLPVFLLDHQPANLGKSQEQGVDLQMSGHTHKGQFFPNQFITHRIFEDDYGYLRKGDLQVIVSSGYGTWGPPIRIGNTPEIVDINVTFEGAGII